MNNKIVGLFLLVLLMATPALATIVITPNTPSSGTQYNNLPSNARNVDINFLVTDDNATAEDHNLTVIIYSGPAWSTFQTLVEDVNVRNTSGNSAINCEPVTDGVLGTAGTLARYTCSLIWTLPIKPSMPDDPYFIDINIMSTGQHSDNVEDLNALISISVSTKLPTGDTLRNLMAIAGVVLAAMVLLGGLVSALAFKTDPAKTAILTIVAAIAVAIGAQIIGVLLITV